MRRMRLIAISGIIGLTAAFGAGAAIAAPGAASGAVRDGSTLTVAHRPAVTATANELFGVSCPAVKQCIAVGFSQSAYGGNGGPLAETWNGKAWKAAVAAAARGRGLRRAVRRVVPHDEEVRGSRPVLRRPARGDLERQSRGPRRRCR